MKTTLVVRLSVAVAVLGSAVVPALASAAPAMKVDVCHSEGNGSFHHINISENAFDKHVGHGDASPGQPVPGMTGYSFDSNCQAVADEVPDPAPMLAVAYSNLDGVDGFDPEGADVLIAKWVDTNLDGVASAGDTVVTNQYPLNFDATAFGDFATTSHTVESASTGLGEIVGEGNALQDAWIFRNNPVDGQSYEELKPYVGSATVIRDEGITNVDRIAIDPSSPSMPSSAVFLSRFPDSTDQDFIDVEIFAPAP